MERGTYFDFYEVRTGLYAAIVIDGKGALGNACIVDFGDKTLIFDTTQSIPAARELQQFAKAFTGKDASIVVNSHRHNDHVLGNQVFADAVIISTQQTRRTMVERLPAFLEFAKAHPEYPKQMRQRLSDTSLNEQGRWEIERDVRDIEHFAAYLDAYHPTLPTLCFDDELQLCGTKRQGQLLTYGGGHSSSDAFLYLFSEKCLLIGDLAFVGYHPAMRDGNPEQWVTILERVLELDFETVIAGHGRVGNRHDVELTRQYLMDLIAATKSNVETSPSADSVPTKYREWRGESVYFGNMKFLMDRYRG